MARVNSTSGNARLAPTASLYVALALLLCACGGGGDGGSGPGDTPRRSIYLKASTSGVGIGWSVAVSADGNTLAVGAPFERSNATGIDGNQADRSAPGAGAVYVFTRSGGAWAQQAYVKASNTGANDAFGGSLALSADGNTLAVGANGEDSNAVGIDGNQADNSAAGAGAVYVFTRSGAIWTQQAYIKASNAGANDAFGGAVALSGDGSTLAVGAAGEDSGATGIDGNQADDTAVDAGAVYVFARSGATWTQQAYVKASNTGGAIPANFPRKFTPGDRFGTSVALSGDGKTLAVGAIGEASRATGIGGNQADDVGLEAGAVYVFILSGSAWSQQAYVKASNTGTGSHNDFDEPSTPGDRFGGAVALSADGNTLAVGATGEDSRATGIGGNQADESASAAGAVYVFTRSGAAWTQQAYIKASNTRAVGPDWPFFFAEGDYFGAAVALSADGNMLAVGAIREGSAATGIGGNQADDSAINAGAVYVFARSGATWAQQAYVKASNTGAGDQFGWSIALSGDGKTLAVGATGEDSSATGIDGNQADNTASGAGAVYVFM